MAGVQIGSARAKRQIRDACIYGGFQTNDRLNFRSTSNYIYSSAANTLNVVAGTTIAMSGAITMDSTLGVTGTLTTSGDVTFNLGTGDAFTITVTDLASPMTFTNTVTTAGRSGCRASFTVSGNVAFGSYVNALKGYMDFTTGTAGRNTGLASAICAELRMPNWAAGTGHYYPLEVEFVGQTNSGPGVHHGFITCRASGTLTNFNASGYFMEIEGLTAGSTAMLSTTSQTLKVGIGTTPTSRYMVLSQITDGLGLGNSSTAQTQTYNGTKQIACYTTCASSNTGTSYEPQYFQNTLTGANQVGGRFRVAMITNVRLGTWANAFKASVDLQTSGSCSGLFSVINAEFNMMASDPPSSGMYAVLELNFTMPSGHAGDNRRQFIYMNTSDTASTGMWDTYGYFFELAGCSSTAQGAWYDKGSAISPGNLGEMLRVRTPGGARFIALYDSYTS